MELWTALQSLLIGLVGGILYGLSFGLFRRRKALSFILIVTRLSLVGVLLFYLLRSSSIHFILLLPSFLGAFWLTVFNRKAILHERL